MTKSPLSHYEQSALGDAVSSLSPYRTPISALVQVLRAQVLGAQVPGVRVLRDSRELPVPDTFALALWRILAAMGHVAAKTVRSERLDELRRWAMRPVRSLGDRSRLDLWEVDEAVRWVEPKYVALGALVGLASGPFGMRGLAVGKPLLTLLALRQIHEYAMRYGFDVDDPEERAFAVRVLVAALCPNRLPGQVQPEDLSQVTRTAKYVGRFVGFFDAVRSVVRRVLRTKKSSRAVPAVTAVGMAAYGAWFLRGVAEVASLAYRERFVARKHHVTVASLEVTSCAHSEACPPAPFERTDEARPASAPAGAAR